MTNEVILTDRLQKIKQIITQHGEENFYNSFSGGKDSTVLSALVDMALPNNQIPRVYANTGIELNMIRDFVFDMAKTDDRVVIIKPSVPNNFDRTGCKGCPFAINLQHELDTLEKYFPNERKQCEIIWKPVYNEYRRLGYRLKKE